jgi:hypothetical protein
MENIIYVIFFYFGFFLCYILLINKFSNIFFFIILLAVSNLIFLHNTKIDPFVLNFININYFFNLFCFTRFFFEKSPTILLFKKIKKIQNYRQQFIQEKLMQNKILLLEKQRLIIIDDGFYVTNKGKFLEQVYRFFYKLFL